MSHDLRIKQMVHSQGGLASYNRYANRGVKTLKQLNKDLHNVQKLARLINVEFRTLTTSFTADPNSTGAVVNLTAIAQGDNIGNRQGNKIRMKHISVRGSVAINASATATRLRMMIVRDNNGSTTIPAITALFSSSGVFNQNRNKLGDPQTNSRFSIIFDKFLLLNQDGREQGAVNYSSSLDHHVYFSATASTDEGKGALYLFISSNEATNDPIVSVDCMLKWIDN